MRYENGTGMFVIVEEEESVYDEKIDGGGAVKERKRKRDQCKTPIKLLLG